MAKMKYRRKWKSSVSVHDKTQDAADRRLARKGDGKYIYRDDKPSCCYHLKTSNGTVCKMENCIYYRFLNAVSDKAPHGRALCSMCLAIQERDKHRVPWERLDTW